MSWAIVARVLKTKVGSSSGKAVLLALANHCDEAGGNCYPGQDAIRAIPELSLDTIQRQLDSLVSAGIVTRKKRPAVRGRWAAWSYQIDLSKIWANQAASCGSVDHAAS